MNEKNNLIKYSYNQKIYTHRKEYNTIIYSELYESNKLIICYGSGLIKMFYIDEDYTTINFETHSLCISDPEFNKGSQVQINQIDLFGDNIIVFGELLIDEDNSLNFIITMNRYTQVYKYNFYPNSIGSEYIITFEYFAFICKDATVKFYNLKTLDEIFYLDCKIHINLDDFVCNASSLLLHNNYLLVQLNQFIQVYNLTDNKFVFKSCIDILSFDEKIDYKYLCVLLTSISPNEILMSDDDVIIIYDMLNNTIKLINDLPESFIVDSVAMTDGELIFSIMNDNYMTFVTSETFKNINEIKLDEINGDNKYIEYADTSNDVVLLADDKKIEIINIKENLSIKTDKQLSWLNTNCKPIFHELSNGIIKVHTYCNNYDHKYDFEIWK
jgi:hypothetical protein